MPSSSTPSTKSLVVGRATYKQTLPGTSPDVITFQHNQTCVFVKLAESYQKAIDIAQKEYDDLGNVPRDRIGFFLDDVNHGGRHVRISESAWSAITPKLSRGTIVNIVVRPDSDIKVSGPPPQYLEVSGPALPEKDYEPTARGSSPPMSRPPSRASVNSSKSGSKLFSWIGSSCSRK